jgi:hypothetical protein
MKLTKALCVLFAAQIFSQQAQAKEPPVAQCPTSIKLGGVERAYSFVWVYDGSPTAETSSFLIGGPNSLGWRGMTDPYLVCGYAASEKSTPGQDQMHGQQIIIHAKGATHCGVFTTPAGDVGACWDGPSPPALRVDP